MNSARAKWKTFIFERDGESLTAYLHPPGTFRNPNFWAWSCKKIGINGRSLKVGTHSAAKDKVLSWIKGEPIREQRMAQENSILSWDDWDSIQVAHFNQKRDKWRSGKTLEECRKARRLFVAVTGAESASSVGMEMVAKFQLECPLKQSKFGRPYGKTTVVKTMAHMSASFNRCCSISGRKCIRGVVPPERLLTTNPFEQVQWLETDGKVIRQFSHDELKDFLSWKYLGGCPLISLFAKLSLWACGRLEEMTELQWSWVSNEGYITIPNEKAKWGKGKTFRIPLKLLAELEAFRKGSPFVWAGYVEQLREFHFTTGHGSAALKIKDFKPERLRVSFQKWISEWVKQAKIEGGLSHHAFRRTGLQWSREGQLRHSEADYAKAANVGLSVADKHYTTKPQQIWADIAYRNLTGEIGQDAELAAIMGLPSFEQQPTVTLDSVKDAIDRNDLEEAMRLLGILKPS